MSKRANPTLIGTFVVGAVVIAVIALLLLGGGDIFRKKPKFVLYFDGSVKGLNVGAPVNFRGVKIGTVTDIKIVVHESGQALDIPVVIEIDPISFTFPEGEERSVKKGVDIAVENGLRAQLEMQSLLTGQLFIQMDFHADKPAQLQGGNRLPEIPTIQTPIQELGKKLEDFPLQQVLDNVSSAMDGIDKLVNSPDLQGSLQTINKAFEDVSTLMNNLNTRTQPLESGLNKANKAIDQADATLQAAEQTFRAATDSIDQVDVTLQAAEQTFRAATDTIGSMKDLVGDDSEMLDALDEALSAISDAARSVAELADAIERQPEAILRGKGAGRGN